MPWVYALRHANIGIPNTCAHQVNHTDDLSIVIEIRFAVTHDLPKWSVQISKHVIAATVTWLL